MTLGTRGIDMQCRHCGGELTPCEHRENSCLGWVHVSDGGHVCQTEDVIARAEPRASDGRYRLFSGPCHTHHAHLRPTRECGQ